MNRSRGRNAYTLIELAVVVVLSSLLIFGMARWLVGIAYSSKVGFEAAAERKQHLALEQISQDLQSARWCRGDGGDARIRAMDANSFTLVGGASTNADTLITWKLENGDLQRGEAALGADCEASITAWVPWVADVDVFELASVKEGAADTSGTDGPCPHEWFERCQVEVIQLTISMVDDPAETSLILYLP